LGQATKITDVNELLRFAVVTGRVIGRLGYCITHLGDGGFFHRASGNTENV